MDNVFICTWEEYYGDGDSFKSAFDALQENARETIDYREVAFYEATREVKVELKFIVKSLNEE